MMCSTSSPSRRLPCSQMSRMTSCGRRSSMAFRASSESRARRVRWPSSCRMPATISRMSASSSTIRMSEAICLLPHSLSVTHRRAQRRVRVSGAAGRGRTRPTTGRVMRISAPCVRPGAGGASSSESVPPCCSTLFCTMARPRPVPFLCPWWSRRARAGARGCAWAGPGRCRSPRCRRVLPLPRTTVSMRPRQPGSLSGLSA